MCAQLKTKLRLIKISLHRRQEKIEEISSSKKRNKFICPSISSMPENFLRGNRLKNYLKYLRHTIIIITIARTYRLIYVTLAKRSLIPDPISQTVIYSSDEPLSKNITNVLVIRSEFSSLKRKEEEKEKEKEKEKEEERKKNHFRSSPPRS